MLRGTEKWVTYFVLLIVFIFGIVLLARQIGVTTNLKHSLVQARQLHIYSGDLKRIVHLHTASSKVFFLTFFALCLLVIGVIIIVRGTEKAYDIAEVKEKVRYHLKSTTPGVVLVVLSSFLLAFCAFRSSHIETIYSSRLIDYNNFKIASQAGSLQQTVRPVLVDTFSLNKLKTKDTKKTVVIVNASKKEKHIAPAIAKPLALVKNTTIRKRKDVAHKQIPAIRNAKHMATAKSKSKAGSAMVLTETAKIIPSKATTEKQLAGKDKKNIEVPSQPEKKLEPAAQEKKVTINDIKWAEQFQRNVTIYGYTPNLNEQTRFSTVLEYMQLHGGSSLNKDLTWAYLFLEKTKRGYEPKAGEMQRYESIIQSNLKSAAVTSQNYEL